MASDGLQLLLKGVPLLWSVIGRARGPVQMLERAACAALQRNTPVIKGIRLGNHCLRRLPPARAFGAKGARA